MDPEALEEELQQIAGEAGLQFLDLYTEGWDAVQDMVAGRFTPSSNRYADLVRFANDFRRFDDSFELLCHDFLENHIQILPHQIDAAKMVFTQMNLRAILADEVGLGKTIEAGIIAKELQVRGMLNNVLVLAPKTLMGQWMSEFHEKFEIPLLDIQEKTWLAKTGPRYWVANSRSWYRTNSHVRDLILAQDWDLVIVDEAHHFKKATNKGYKALVPGSPESLESRYLLLLTATPVQNSLRELYALMSLVRPGVLGSFPEFKRKYFGDSKGEAARNERALLRIVQANMIRRRRMECGIDYTDRVPAEHVLQYPAACLQLYADILASDANPLQKVNWLRQATSSLAALVESMDNMPAMRSSAAFESAWAAVKALGDTPEPKVAKLIELAQSHDRVVAFTEYKATQQAVRRQLENQGILVHVLHGQMTLNQRRESIRAFRDKGGVFLSLPAGSEGLNLQFSNVIVNFDLPWNPMKVEQRIGRVHRIGQKSTVYVHTLAYEGTIEEYVLDTLYRKLNLFRLCVGEIDNLFTTGTGDEDFEMESYIRRLVNEVGTLEAIQTRLHEISRRIRRDGRTEIASSDVLGAF